MACPATSEVERAVASVFTGIVGGSGRLGPNPEPVPHSARGTLRVVPPLLDELGSGAEAGGTGGYPSLESKASVPGAPSSVAESGGGLVPGPADRRRVAVARRRTPSHLPPESARLEASGSPADDGEPSPLAKIGQAARLPDRLVAADGIASAGGLGVRPGSTRHLPGRRARSVPPPGIPPIRPPEGRDTKRGEAVVPAHPGSPPADPRSGGESRETVVSDAFLRVPSTGGSAGFRPSSEPGPTARRLHSRCVLAFQHE